MKFFVFAASHRTNSYNRMLAKLAAAHLAAAGHTIDFAEYNELNVPVYNDEEAEKALPPIVRQLGERIASANGLLICAPEYNWSYPGSLKNVIDWLSRVAPLPTQDKPVFIASASTSSRGGILGLNHLETPLRAIGMHVFPRMFPLGNVASAFNEHGTLIDNKQQQSLTKMLDDYRTFTLKLTQPK